jgi:hypothetical protein
LPRLHRRRLAFAARRGQDPATVALRSRESFLREQAIAGDPQACHDQLAALARAGVTHLRLVLNGSGEWSNERALAAMTLFASSPARCSPPAAGCEGRRRESDGTAGCKRPRVEER